MIDMIAPIASLSAAFLMSRGNVRLIPYAYILYILGSILWILVGIHASLNSLVFTNVCFILLEVVALYKWVCYNKDITKN